MTGRTSHSVDSPVDSPASVMDELRQITDEMRKFVMDLNRKERRSRSPPDNRSCMKRKCWNCGSESHLLNQCPTRVNDASSLRNEKVIMGYTSKRLFKSLRSVTGEKKQMLGKITLNFGLAALEVFHSFWVAEIEEDCLLGLDFLDHHDC